jgi:hypothetical protein
MLESKFCGIVRIDDLPTKILYQITEPLQNQKDGKQRKRLTDITLEVEDRAKHQESELEQKGPTNSRCVTYNCVFIHNKSLSFIPL